MNDAFMVLQTVDYQSATGHVPGGVPAFKLPWLLDQPGKLPKSPTGNHPPEWHERDVRRRGEHSQS